MLGTDSDQILSLIPILSASFAVSSFFFLMCGLIMGLLLSKCSVSWKSKKKSPPAPIYEHVTVQTCTDFNPIKVENNVAYGPIQ